MLQADSDLFELGQEKSLVQLARTDADRSIHARKERDPREGLDGFQPRPALFEDTKKDFLILPSGALWPF